MFDASGFSSLLGLGEEGPIKALDAESVESPEPTSQRASLAYSTALH